MLIAERLAMVTDQVSDPSLILNKIYDLLWLIFIVISVYCGYGLADKVVSRK